MSDRPRLFDAKEIMRESGDQLADSSLRGCVTSGTFTSPSGSMSQMSKRPPVTRVS